MSNSSYKEMLIYRNPPEFYSEEQIKNAVENPVIIHFTTSFLSERPWIKGSKHIYLDKWMHYKNMSPWRDSPLWDPPHKSLMKKTVVGIIKILPRPLMVRVAGVFHKYGRPLLYRIKS